MTDNITLLTDIPVVTHTFGDNWWGVALVVIGVIMILVGYYYHKRKKSENGTK